MMCYPVLAQGYRFSVRKHSRYTMMKKSLLRLAVKRACLALGLMSCSCLLTSCSSVASLAEYLLSVPFNIIDYVLTSALP